MSRTYRKNPPQEVCAERILVRSQGRVYHIDAVPAIARDGKVALSYRREKGWARRVTMVKYRAQCKQALYHDKEFPRVPHTSGWVTW